VIHKAKDNSFKLILGDHDLFVEFLRDFIGIDVLSGVTPGDIEDITERLLPLFQEGKDSDTIKRVNLKGSAPLFVIAIVEHQSQVNYRTSFRMLQYITLVLTEYEKEANKEKKNASHAKGFKFPPVLPIVFYDGGSKWTAETEFSSKVELKDVFHKYIPKFEYELVSLDEYSVEDLAKFGDTLSIIMIIDKIRTADGIRLLGELPPDYIERLALNIPQHLHKLLADVIRVLLKKINVPDDEIEAVTEKIHARRINEMFNIVNYDVQETRRIAREEGRQEGRQEGRKEGRQEGRKEGRKEGRQEGIEKNQRQVAIEMKKEGFADEVISRVTKLTIEKVRELNAKS